MQKVETLNEREYLELFDMLDSSIDVSRQRYNWCISKEQLYVYALQRVQRILSWGNNRNLKLYKIVRDTKRSYGNPTLINMYGVRLVKEMLDIIDNMSDENIKPDDSLLELRDSLSGMRSLSSKAKEVSDKCEVVSGKLDKICQYVEGSSDEF